MSNSWYLNRHKQTKGPDSGKKRALVRPPYHVHPELEDELEKVKDYGQIKKFAKDAYWASVNASNKNGHAAKIAELKEEHDELQRNHSYHFTNSNGILKKAEKALKAKLDALEKRVETLEKP